MNPNLHTFIANSAQLGIKADFFKIMSNIDFALATGATGIVGYWTGSDLQNGIQNVISVTTQYKSRNYAELHRRNVNPRVVPAVYHGEPFHLTKAFFDPTGTTAVISASSIAMVGTGLKMIEWAEVSPR